MTVYKAAAHQRTQKHPYKRLAGLKPTAADNDSYECETSDEDDKDGPDDEWNGTAPLIAVDEKEQVNRKQSEGWGAGSGAYGVEGGAEEGGLRCVPVALPVAAEPAAAEPVDHALIALYLAASNHEQPMVSLPTSAKMAQLHVCFFSLASCWLYLYVFWVNAALTQRVAVFINRRKSTSSTIN